MEQHLEEIYEARKQIKEEKEQKIRDARQERKDRKEQRYQNREEKLKSRKIGADPALVQSGHTEEAEEEEAFEPKDN